MRKNHQRICDDPSKVQKGAWETAEAVYPLPLKHIENEHLRASLARVK